MGKLSPWLFAVALFAIILALTAQSVVITAGPKVTFEWDPVSTFSDGTSITSGVVSYEVTLDGDLLGMTANTEYLITLPDQGLRVFRVRTVLTQDSGESTYSEYATLSVVVLYRPSKPTSLDVR